MNLDQGDTVTGSISVSGGLGDAIDFWVTDPAGAQVLDFGRVSGGTEFSFSADRSGAYSLHFENGFSSTSSKTVTVTYTLEKRVAPGLGIGPSDSSFIVFVVIVVVIVVVVAMAVAMLRGKPPAAAGEKIDRPIEGMGVSSMKGVGLVASVFVIALMAGAVLGYVALPSKVETVTETMTESTTETMMKPTTTTETLTRSATETITETVPETLIVTTTVSVSPSTAEQTTPTPVVERLVMVSVYTEFDGDVFSIQIYVWNAGTSNATVEECFIDGDPWYVFGATSCTALGKTIGGPGRGACTITPKRIVPLRIEIPGSVVSSGQKLEITLRTATGMLYPQNVVLP